MSAAMLSLGLRLDAMIRLRQATKIARILDLQREERHPEPERPWRRHGVYRLHPPRRGCVGIRGVEQTPETKDEE